ncbi:MAG: serine hydrolase [Pseudomonadota bacterium]
MSAVHQRPHGVTLANWRLAPYHAWAFHHVRELIPTAAIAGRPSEPQPDPGPALDLSAVGFVDRQGRAWTLAGLLEQTATDAFLVLHRGRLVHEAYAPTYDPRCPHLLFSVSKSITGALAGCLVAEGAIRPDDHVIDHVPETAGSAYETCTLRHLLDMTVSMDLEENYTDPDSDYMRYREATGWNPPRAPADLLSFLPTIRAGNERHGACFRYRSPNSDLLGIVLERATGQPFADLLSERIWQKLGCSGPADITVDRLGAPRAAGGVSTTARDLALFGDMMRCDGTYGGAEVVPSAWIDDIRSAGDPEAWANGDYSYLIPGGRYRAQWYATAGAEPALCAIGIHGQWLYIDPVSETVMVKLSAQTEPIDDPLDMAMLEGFACLARSLRS